MTRILLTCLTLLTWTAAGVATTNALGQTTLTYSDLIARYSDLSQPAVLPRAGETCRQWSSWDRSSRYDAETGQYVNWGANNDGPGFIRQEGDDIVMAEMEGPGCIWRIWSARALEGHVKIYLDGSETPAVDLPFARYFSGETAPFAYRMLSYDLATLGCRGQNLYFPIPYRQSCKIVAEPGWGRYYQFVYTTFPDGTELPTFSSQLAAEHADQLRQLDALLEKRLETGRAEPIEGQAVEQKSLALPAGQATEAASLQGARAITGIRARLGDFADRDEEMAVLREICLQVTFDNQQQPAVWCPLGDFFGTAPGRNLYASYVTGMTDDGAYAWWYMPFARSAKVELVNAGSSDRKLDLEIMHAPLGRPFDGLGYFHCKWHRDTVTLPEDRWPDWTLLRTTGRGRFLGVMLHVWNPRGGWWGEGDEKFFVDGEKYPSTFGTGSEDYFGYAWCHPGLFQRAFHGQSMTMGNQGHQSVFRWHVADNVPFQQSFEGCIEKYYRAEEKGTEYAATVCWYLAPGGVDPYGPVPVEQRHDYYVRPPLVAGGFRVLGTPAGNVQTQGMANFGDSWQGQDQLWWTGVKPGDRLQLVVPVAEAGKYEVQVVLTKARDYAIVQLALDGKQVGDEIDLYNPSVTATEPISLGTFDLSGQGHVLTVEIAGANPRAVRSYMFGIDRIILKPAE